MSQSLLIARVSDYIGKNRFVIGFAVLLCLSYLYFFGFRALIKIDLELQSHNPTMFKVYWAEKDADYSEKNMREVLITRYRNSYKFFLTNLKSIERLRIDPIAHYGVVKLKQFRVSQLGFEPIEIQGIEDFKRLTTIQQLETNIESNGLKIKSTGLDGQLELRVEPDRNTVFPLVHLVNLLFVFISTLLLARILAVLFKRDLYVCAGLIIVLVLVTNMAVLTGEATHPDEGVHAYAVSYYADNWLPPPIVEPQYKPSFSIYGYSRLANFESYYPIAGIFTRILKPLQLSELLDARIFGLFMIALLIFWTMRNTASRIFVLPLLISGQIWYLFSYVNSDAFALVVLIVMSYQAAYKESMLNRFLTEDQPGYFVLQMVALGALVGLMLLLKTNSYFFLLFLGLYLLWRIFQGDFPSQKRLWVRLICIGVIGLSFYGARIGMDYAANGPDPSAVKARMIEEYANKDYKPSTPMDQKHIYLYLKERGFSLDDIIHKEQWGGKTYKTAFGAYGYTQYLGSTTFYKLVTFFGSAIFLLMFLTVLIRGGPSIQILFSIVIFSAVMLVTVLLWRSWTISFQPQGRYLTPILPMLGILYYHIRPYLYDKLLTSLNIGLFLLAVYSFIFIGLHDVPKVALPG